MNSLQSKLVAAGQSLDLNLPQIAVVGAQSAGKSSVLENIVGKEFLPRGSGVVTRRPILIQLYPSTEEYGVFGNKPNEKITDFEQIRQKITAQMPKNNDFSSVPIQIRIYSPRVLKLTLVDLPGIVKVAVDRQPNSCVHQVRSMVLSHIRQEGCIILAVTPASQDVATSDALDIAQEVDPDRVRTIGVLTKIDLMDEGTDASDILENKQIKLKRGYVAVLNRSQRDIMVGRDIQSILEREQNFFDERECYQKVRHRCGTPFLQKLLNKTLRTHIKNSLPEVRNRLAQALLVQRQELKTLLQKMGGGVQDRQYYMSKVINSFIREVTGNLMGHSDAIEMTSLSSGVYINYKLNSEVQKLLNLRLVPNLDDVTILVTSLTGIRDSLSVSTLALDAMCRKLMSKYDTPLEQSVTCIRKVLEETIEEAAEKMNQYPSTKHEMLYRISRCVERHAQTTLERLKEHVQAEMFFVNLKHPEMDLSLCNQLYPAVCPSKSWEMDLSEDWYTEPESTTNNQSTGLGSMTKPLLSVLRRNSSTQNKVQYVMVVIAKYMEIVQKQISDIAIKYICYFLIGKVLKFIKFDLLPLLLTSTNLDSLTEDCEDDFQRKEKIEATCRVFKDALDAIQDF